MTDATDARGLQPGMTPDEIRAKENLLQPGQEQFMETLAEIRNQRTARLDGLEISPTKVEGEDGYRFEGHAAVFGETADLDLFTEEIERGTFRRVLATNPLVPFLHEHDPKQLLASTRTGRLKLSETTRGLGVQADVVKTHLSTYVREMAKAGEITGMSFGFVNGAGNYRVENRAGKPHRIITNIKRLTDVCTTWDPAYTSAEAEFRSLTSKLVASPEVLQQLHMGAYPQLVERADLEGTDEETEEARSAGEAITDEAGAAVFARLAARQRRLAIMTITFRGEPE